METSPQTRALLSPNSCWLKLLFGKFGEQMTQPRTTVNTSYDIRPLRDRKT